MIQYKYVILSTCSTPNQVETNGLITFGRQVLSSTPETFPTENADIFWSYIVAPFWSDANTSTNGSVYWEIHIVEQSAAMLNQVSNLVQSQYPESQFSGTWMLVATWKDVLSPTLTMVSSTTKGLLT